MTGVELPGGEFGVPPDWAEKLREEFGQPYWATLMTFVMSERAEYEVYPSEDRVFAAFEASTYAATRVLILGQDPYFKPDQAIGLSFAVADGVTPPPSLQKILRELRDDLSEADGDLAAWARQGVLLLNTTLTVRRGQPNSHRGRGWELFTDAVIRCVNEKSSRVVFILWGRAAQAKAAFIDTDRHTIIASAHPAAWANAATPFLGSKPFSRANRQLIDAKLKPINWTGQDPSADR